MDNKYTVNRVVSFAHAYQEPRFVSSYYVNQTYSKKHAHMLHKHSEVLELLYVNSGTGRYIVGKREYAVTAGDMVICNAGVLHGEAPFQENNNIETYCCALTNVQLPALPKNCLTDKNHKPVFHLESNSETVSGMMKALYSIFSHKEYNQDICEHLCVSILLLMSDILANQVGSTKEKVEQKTEDFVRKVTDYLDTHYAESLTLEDISNELYVSSSTLSHIFKRETGLAPIQYMIHRRIGEAQSLLMETNLPICNIEESLGFGSSCHFSSMFKKYVGISPKGFRNHFQKKK